MDRGAWSVTVHGGPKKLDTAKQLHFLSGADPLTCCLYDFEGSFFKFGEPLFPQLKKNQNN